MKKVILGVLLIVLVITLAGCGSKITVPDFYNMEYGDVVRWGSDNDIEIVPSSEYTDEVEPNHVFGQSVAAGESIAVDSEIMITYSRGYDPNGVINLPDFTDSTEEDIRTWLAENDISKYYFYDTFNPNILEAGFVSVEVEKTDDTRTDYIRKDTYTFYFSKGPIEIEELKFDDPTTVRGVNLGGWFVLEGWMTPSLFEGVSGSDETIFLQEKPNAEQEIKEHWDTFITEDDFIWLESVGVEYVRLPIPWWLWGVENAYEGTEHEVDYVASISYIDRAMVWAEDHNIKVLLDLHTAPGGQNGFDNGGLTGVLDWPQYSNVQTTLDVIDDIAAHFRQYDSLWGIQVLNEPAWVVDMNILQQYYEDAYEIIRWYDNDVWIGFHDGFRSYMDYSWKPFFDNNNFHNVFFDIHLYHVFGDWPDYDIHDHIRWVHVENKKHIDRYAGTVPVVIGEWSLALPGDVYDNLDAQANFDVRVAFANAQLNVYEQGMGYFFWNYKIAADSHKEWDFRRLVDLGYFPDDFSTKEE